MLTRSKLEGMQELDNPIWSALSTAHAQMAVGDQLARCYPPSFTTLGGLVEATPAAFESLGKLVPVGQTICLFKTEDLAVPANWQQIYSGPLDQMICKTLMVPKVQCDMMTLTQGDIPDMLDLAKICLPGPFADDTIKFGNYFGVREQGKLVAMAGQRMQINDFIEVSAVCTHPDFRGRGLARALVHKISELIFSHSRTPILHVRPANEGAIKSYAALGFAKRASLQMWVLRNGN